MKRARLLKFLIQFSAQGVRLVTACSLMFISNLALAVGEIPQSFTLDGRLYSDAAATTAMIDSSVALKIQILTPAQDCVLYEETQTVNTSSSNGYFTIQVGSATSAAKRSSNDSNNSMATVYSNTLASVNGKLVSNGAGCTYNPANGDQRFVRMLVTPSSDSVTRTLSPNVAMDSVPSAVVAERAESLQGLNASQFLQAGTGDLTQSNLQSVFATGNAAKLNSLLSVPPSNYVTVNSSNGTVQLPAVAAPSSPVAGEIWYDSGNLKFYNGTSVQTLGVSGAGITSLTIGSGLSPTGTITAGGSTIAVDTGTTVGKIVQVQTGGKLPALDGSDLTVLNGSAITSGTIGGSTAISTSGNLQTSHDITAKRLFVQDSGSNYVGFQAPATVTSTYSMTLPAAQGGANTILLNDGSGNLSWVAQNTGSVTSVSGTSPINITGTAQSPVVGITKADGTHDGYLAQGDWTTFSNKLSTVLASAKIWVGNGSNVAAPVTPGGDVTLDNTGVFSVQKVKGTTISATPTLTGQVLRYDGTNYTPNFVAMTDLRSTVTGTNQFASSCGANQTLTYNSVGDVMSCSNIAIADSQVTFASKPANTILAAPNGSAGAPTFRTLASADIPSLDWSKISTGKPTTLSGYGITDSLVGNLGGSPGIQSGVDASKPAGPTAGTIYFATDTNKIYQYNSGAWATIAQSSGATPGGSAGGDLSGSYPNPGVSKIKGTTVSAVPTSTGQVLRYDGTNYTPNFIAMTDLRSSVTGSNQFASSCGANQTLSYNSVGDIMSCTSIAISDSQVTFGSKTANTFLAAPNGSAGAPTFRTIASTDFPAVANFGVNATSTGQLILANGNASGASVTIQNNSATAAYNFNLPATAGTSGQVLLSGGGGAAPMTWGTLAVGGGGTGLSGGVSGGIPYFATASTMASSALLTNHAILIGGGAGAAPFSLSSNGTSGNMLISGGSSADPTWGALNLAGGANYVSGNLPVGNGGTGNSTLTSHGLLVGQGSSAVAATAAGGSGTLLTGQGASADPTFSASPTLGVNGTTTGVLNLATNAGGGASIAVQNGGATTGYNFNLPTTAGTSGYALTSGGGGASPMTWTAVAPAVGSSNITTLGTVTTGTWNASTITVPYGGTGATTLTAHGVLLGEGTSAIAATAAGTAGNVLTSGGSSADPSWGALNLAGGSNSISGTLPVGNGGTGATTLTGAGIVLNGGNSFAGAATIGTNDNNTLGFKTNGTVNMTMLANGNVGIGTTSPSAKLEVAGDLLLSGANRVINTNGNNSLQIYAGDSNSQVNIGKGATSLYKNYAHSFDIAGVGTAIYINGSGNVGVGTSAPVTTLDVNGSIRAVSTNTAGSQFIAIGEAIDNSTPFYIQRYGSTHATYPNGVDVWNATNGILRFGTNGTERIRIDSSGNVGIGTSSPETLLNTVQGASAALYFDAYVGATTTGTALAMRQARGVPGAPTASQADDRLFSVGGRGYGSTGFSTYNGAAVMGYASENWTDAAQGTYLTLRTTATGTANSAERVRIDQNGYVGIGTTTPGQKLSVAGTIESTSGGIKFPDGTTQATAASAGTSGFSNLVTFTSSGTWTIPAGITRAKVTVIGGGGGGGGSSSSGTSSGDGGGGGGGCISVVTGLTPGNTVSVTVGAAGSGGSGASGAGSTAGGTSSFGAFCSATGGAGGNGGRSNAIIPTATAGGVGSGGTLNLPGGKGGIFGQSSFYGQPGGSTILGYGVPGSPTFSGAQAGNAGAGYGAGGGGAAFGGSAAGGAGPQASLSSNTKFRNPKHR